MASVRTVDTGPIIVGSIITHPSPPSPPKRQFDAQDCYKADQWCKAHGYTTTQDVVLEIGEFLEQEMKK